MTHDTTKPKETAKRRREASLLSGLVICLESIGVDCSRTSNQDDAFVFMMLIGILIGFGIFFYSQWWSGFIVSAVIFSGVGHVRLRQDRLSR